MQKKRCKKMITFLLIVSLILSITVFPCYADSIASTASKLDARLRDRLETLEDADDISVAIWFKDISDTVKASVTKEIYQKTAKRENIDLMIPNDGNKITRIFDLPFFSELSKEAADRLICDYASEMSNVIFEYNQKKLQQLISIFAINPSVTYIDSLSPMVLAEVTKCDLIKIETAPQIDIIYSNTNNELDNQTANISNEYYYPERSITTDYGYWQANTYTDLIRNAYSLDGTGVKIGLVNEGFPNLNDITLQDAVNNHRIFESYTGNNYVSNSATYFASMLIGKYGYYSGIVPNAMLYFSSFDVTDETSFYAAVKSLILYGVRVIDISSFWGANESTYDNSSKYIDYIAYQYDAVICLPVGDAINSNEQNNICNGAMAYNAIAVGNIDNKNTNSTNDDEIRITSSYTTGNSIVYKPDICAPGTNVFTYTYQYDPMTSTRTATTIVAGICAQLVQYNINTMSYFHPMKIKSAIMSSANRIAAMDNNYSTLLNNSMIMDREYGAGMIDAYSALKVFYYGNNYSELVGYENIPVSYTYEISVTDFDIIANRDIYISLNWYDNVEANIDLSAFTTFNPFYHELLLLDSDDQMVARSRYNYDRKEYIHYHPTERGTYTIEVDVTGYATFTDEYSLSYSVK